MTIVLNYRITQNSRFHNGVISSNVEPSKGATYPNGDFVHIADVTSDITDYFSCAWTPDKIGKYQLSAVFRRKQIL